MFMLDNFFLVIMDISRTARGAATCNNNNNNNNNNVIQKNSSFPAFDLIFIFNNNLFK